MGNTAELTIVLKADGSGLTGTVRVSADEVRKLGTALDETGSKAQGASRKLEDSGKTAERVGKMIGAAAAAAAAGYLVMTRNAINAADQVFVVSQRLGMTAEALSTFQAGARQNGVEVRQLNAYLEGFANTSARAAGGAKQQAQLFRDMGISVRDASGQFKSIDALLPEVAAKFATYREGPDKAALANKLFGEGASALIPMLNQLGEQGFDKAREAAEQMGLVIDGQTAKAAHDLHDQIDALNMVTAAYFNRVARDVLPNLVLFAQGLTDQAKAATDSNDKTTILGNGIRGLVTWLIEAYGWAQRFGVGLADAVAKAGLEIEKLKVKLGDSGYREALFGALTGNAQAATAVKYFDQVIEQQFAGRTAALQSAADESFAEIDRTVKTHVGNINRTIGDLGTTAAAAGVTLRAGSAPIAEYGNAAAEAAPKVQKLTAEQKLQAAAITDSFRAQDTLIGLGDSLAEKNRVLKETLLGLSPAQRDYNKALREAQAEFNKILALGPPTQQALDALAEVTAAAAENRNLTGSVAGQDDAINQAKELAELFGELGTATTVDGIVQQMERVKDAIREACDLETVERLQSALNGLKFQAMAAGAVEALQSMQSMSEEGSRSYEAMGLAIQTANIAAGIAAIVNQGMGDPYTAIPRMIAMAAMVAQLVDGIGSFAAGGFSDTAKERQASQGTGSVLGDAKAKSESSAKALEITADATSQLVGLNRGMLSALLALQAGLGAAGGLLARGAGDADFSGMDLAVGESSFWSGPLDLLDVFGGSSKITDQGIVIFGGALNELLESIAVGAYQEVQSRSWAFGSTQTNEGIVDVSDQFGKQFQLVIGSIIDTVREGALALGVLPEDIEARLAAYQVEEIRISLKDLSAEEKQAELEAVFSQMFDGVAFAVVPFIEQFQQVGEGLGETLVRVATGVQVTREAMRQLGIAIDETDPERFAQISEGLIAAAGGLDSFISGMQSFVANFAPGSHQFQIASEALASAFEQVGLTVPTTREGMWALMQTLDATTESGKQQIATLLRLSETADEYYKALEAQAAAQADYASFIGDLNKEGVGLSTVSPFIAMRLQIEKWEQDTIRQANALARAAGLQGAAEQDLTLIHEIAAHRIAQAVAELMELGEDLVDRLRGNGSALEDGVDSASQAMGRFGSAMTSVAQAAQSAAQLLLGELSPLNDQQKLQYALGAYQRGTVSKEDVLQVGRRLYASSQAYEDLFNMLQGMPGGVRQGGGGHSGVLASEQDNDKPTAAEIARQRTADAQQLAQVVASLANVQELSYQEVVATLDTSLGELAGWLGLSQEGLNAYLDNLVAQENAVPDTITEGTDRIVAALYDIAGRDVPANLAAAAREGERPMPGGHSNRGGGVSIDRAPPPPRPGRPRTPLEDDPGGHSDRRMGDRLDRLINATREGSDRVVAAVSDGTTATRDVGDTIRRGNSEASANRPRNIRPVGVRP